MGNDKVISVIRSWPDERKRKLAEKEESWMKAPIVFSAVSSKDASDEPLTIKAVMKEYLDQHEVESKKCPFGAEEGKFLGYMVTSEGIRANLKKTKAIADMQSLRTLKEMQSLSGKLAALNRFLVWSAKRALPFFDTLKNITKENNDEYQYTEEAEKAFQEMKNS
nr:reverse transcriptase domain-containing protein [Tanacetum cinerariifolium]